MKRSNVAVAAVAVVVSSFLPSSGAPLALPAGRAASASVFTTSAVVQLIRWKKLLKCLARERDAGQFR